MAPKLAPGSPEWWVERLSSDLDAQARQAIRYELYYDGEQPLPLALSTEQYRREFRDLIAEVRDNWMPLVVDAKAQRLNPVGFRFGEVDADEDANAMWQRNYLDADSKMAHTTALTTGRCPIMVWADKDGEPEITVEHPAHMVVAYAAGGSRRKREAALKRWVDDWSGDTHYNLYLRDGIYKFARSSKGVRRPLTTRAEMVPNPLGVVPVVELRHRLRHRDGLCRSALKEVTSTQDQLNKTLIDMLVAAEFQAFRQRWATGVEPSRDPVTGEPIDPFPTKIDRTWTVPAADAKFGEFGQIDLGVFTGLREHLVQSLASRTATPPHYLISGQTLPNAESVKAAETGLIASVRDAMVPFGETWEEVARLGFAVKSDPRRDEWNAQVIWADPETRSEAEHIDAVLKKRALDVPIYQLWSDAGYTPEQIGRFREMLAAEAAALAAGASPTTEWDQRIREKAETMGALVRSGVLPSSAASVVDLDVSFVDGVRPVTLTPDEGI